MGSKPRLSIGVYQNPRGGRTRESIKKYTDSISGKNRKYRTEISDRGKVRKIELKGGGMSVGQAKIAAKAPPPNVLNGKDLAVLRAEKAKGRGMGLQDESVKPGKVMKAKHGKMMKYKRGSGLDLPVISSVKPAVHKTKKAQKTAVMKEQFNKQKSRTLDYAKKKGLPKPISLIAKGVQAMPLPGRLKLLKSLGKLPFVKGIGKKDVKKKMGGGMMQKPMGYNTGGGTSGDAPDTTKGTSGDAPDTTKLKKTLKGAKDFRSAYIRDEQKVKKKMGGGMMQRPMGNTMMQQPMMQKPMGYKSGGMDTGKVGEMKSIFAVALDKYKKTKPGAGPMGRLTSSDIKKLKKLTGVGKAARPIKKNMGGMMMQRPMGYKHGTSVTAKCKLGRNKATKIT